MSITKRQSPISARPLRGPGAFSGYECGGEGFRRHSEAINRLLTGSWEMVPRPQNRIFEGGTDLWV